MSHVYIYAPPSTAFAAVNDCSTCQRPRRMLGLRYEWHGTTWTCAGCGDEWADGERLERPFCPGWRRKNIEYARAKLATIGVQA